MQFHRNLPVMVVVNKVTPYQSQAIERNLAMRGIVVRLCDFFGISGFTAKCDL